jgi:hypothetical protein
MWVYTKVAFFAVIAKFGQNDPFWDTTTVLPRTNSTYVKLGNESTQYKDSFPVVSLAILKDPIQPITV